MSVGECSMGCVEFVGHDKVVRCAIDEGGGGVKFGGCVLVDPVAGRCVEEKGREEESHGKDSLKDFAK